MLALVVVASKSQESNESFEVNPVPLETPAGFILSGHYGTNFSTRKSYYRRTHTAVRFKLALSVKVLI